MRQLIYLTMITLWTSCATAPQQARSFSQLWAMVRFTGEGKARLEVPPQSWVFSFESELLPNAWEAGILIPTHGEEVIRFPGLDAAAPQQMTAAGDFRYRVEQALREANHSRRWGHPTVGHDYVRALHHLLRWAYAKELGLDADCAKHQELQWVCERDGLRSTWSWGSEKQEFTGVFALRPSWTMRVIFKDIEEKKFARVTLEMVRTTEFRDHVELRQEFFFR